MFHRVWLGGQEPEWLRRLARTWTDNHPEWELRQWTDENVHELFPLTNQAVYDAATAIAPRNVGQLRSDVLRYEILARFGGVWIDADLECLEPIDDLLEGAECFAAWEEQDRWIGNTFLGSVPGHPFMERLVAAIPGSVEANRGRRPNRMTGPHLVTRLWRGDPSGLTILDQSLIFPYSWRDIADHGLGEEHPGAYCCHHWRNKRCEQGAPI